MATAMIPRFAPSGYFLNFLQEAQAWQLQEVQSRPDLSRWPGQETVSGQPEAAEGLTIVPPEIWQGGS